MQSDPYRPPTAAVVEPGEREPRFYTPNQIALATLIGSFPAGCFLMAQNFAGLGRPSARLRTLACGVLGALVLIAIGQIPTDIPGLRLGINIASLVLIRSIAQDLQGDQIQAQLLRGGSLHPTWRALVAGALILALFVLVVLAAAFALVGWSRL
jgi:hypothetical protein